MIVRQFSRAIVHEVALHIWIIFLFLQMTRTLETVNRHLKLDQCSLKFSAFRWLVYPRWHAQYDAATSDTYLFIDIQTYILSIYEQKKNILEIYAFCIERSTFPPIPSLNMHELGTG